MITENFDNYKTGGSHKGFNIEVVDTDTVIGNTNMLQESITLDEALCSDNNLKFGACEASQFSVQVANIFEDFVDKELNVSVTMDGITTKYGTFKVDSDKPTADRVWRVLTCYDKMKDIINANVLEWYKGLKFPMSQKAYRDSFFAFLGIEQVEVSLINDDFMVQGGFTATDTLSGKTIITSICEFNGVFGHINREGKFDYISLDGASTVECPPYENNSVTYEDYETDKITRVTMRGTASDVGTSIGIDGNEYIITNNPIIYGTEGTDELITALTRLLNKVGSISYRPYSVGKTIGNPCVELGDAITVNTRHQTINSYIIKRTLTGIQALRDKYSATGSKVYPVEVNSIREEISRTQGKMNILTQTVDETKSQIVAIQTDLTDNYLTSTQTQTLINQSASQIQATVTQTITAELPDLVDEVTGGLSDRITVVESSYTQLSNEIVMKVKADGTVAQVALGSSAELGSNVLIKGDNIQLDGDVTITDGFVLNAGVIQSLNYVPYVSGMQINLTNGSMNTPYFRIADDGQIFITKGQINLQNSAISGVENTYALSALSDLSSDGYRYSAVLYPGRLNLSYHNTQGLWDYVSSVNLGTVFSDPGSTFLNMGSNMGIAESVYTIGLRTTVNSADINVISRDGNKVLISPMQIQMIDVSNNVLFRVRSNGYVDAPNLITSSNIGSQSVNYANSTNYSNYAGGINGYNYTVGHYLLRSVFNVDGDGRFKLQIHNNNVDGNIYGVRVDYATYAGSATDSTKVAKTGDTLSGGLNFPNSSDYGVRIAYGTRSCSFCVGGGHVNRGIFDYTLGRWMVYSDDTDSYFNGKVKNLKGDLQYAITSPTTSGMGINYIQKYSDSANLALQIYGTNATFNITLWTSDERLKENIKEVDKDILSIINNIKTYSFDFKDKGYGKHTDLGLIAQQLKDYIPEAVMEVPQGEWSEYETLYQIDANKLIPYLIKAVQELSAELKQLKATN